MRFFSFRLRPKTVTRNVLFLPVFSIFCAPAAHFVGLGRALRFILGRCIGRAGVPVRGAVYGAHCQFFNKVRIFTMPFKHAYWHTMPSIYTPYTASYPSITMHYTHTSQLLHTACALYAVCILAWLPCAVLVVLVAFLPWQALGYLLRLYIARIPHMLRHTVY